MAKKKKALSHEQNACDEASICIKDFPCLGILFFFWFKNAHTLLRLRRDKIKGQFGKNTTLTLTKTLPKK